MRTQTRARTANTAAGVTVGDCPCGNPDPHRKFYRDGKGLHRHGFFSVEAGRDQLDELIDAGDIEPGERDRLMRELGASGLPATEEEEAIASLADEYGFLNAAALERVLARIVAAEGISSAVINGVRARVRTMTDDAKIDGAVLILRDQDLGYPALQQKMAEDVEPGLLERVKAKVAEYQAANPPTADPLEKLFRKMREMGVEVVEIPTSRES